MAERIKLVSRDGVLLGPESPDSPSLLSGDNNYPQLERLEDLVGKYSTDFSNCVKHNFRGLEESIDRYTTVRQFVIVGDKVEHKQVLGPKGVVESRVILDLETVEATYRIAQFCQPMSQNDQVEELNHETMMQSVRTVCFGMTAIEYLIWAQTNKYISKLNYNQQVGFIGCCSMLGMGVPEKSTVLRALISKAAQKKQKIQTT